MSVFTLNRVDQESEYITHHLLENMGKCMLTGLVLGGIQSAEAEYPTLSVITFIAIGALGGLVKTLFNASSLPEVNIRCAISKDELSEKMENIKKLGSKIPLEKRDIEEVVKESYEKGDIYIATKKDKVIGILSGLPINENTYNITLIAISQKYFYQGVPKYLLTKFINDLQFRNFKYCKTSSSSLQFEKLMNRIGNIKVSSVQQNNNLYFTTIYL